jgi:hypothetical protein
MLRLILGKNFRAISTEMLASIAGIPLVSIRAVEANRRKLNELDLSLTELLLGTRWDPETRQWISVHSRMSYTRADYQFRAKGLETGLLSAKDTTRLSQSLSCFLSKLEPKDAIVAQVRLHHEILRIGMDRNVDLDTLELLREQHAAELAQIPRDMQLEPEHGKKPETPRQRVPKAKAKN